MATVKEQLESLAVVDTLKREENPIAGEWEKVGTNAGKCTTTGYALITEKTLSACKRKTKNAMGNGLIAKFTHAVLPAINHELELQTSTTGIRIKKTAAAKCTVIIFGKATKTVTEVTYAAGDTFGFSWEKASKKVTVYRKPSAGAWTEVGNAEASEAPPAEDNMQIFFVAGTTAGTEGRITEYAAGQITETKTVTGEVELTATFTPEIEFLRKVLKEVELPFTITPEIEFLRTVLKELELQFTLTPEIEFLRKVLKEVELPFTFSQEIEGIRKLIGELELLFTLSLEVEAARTALKEAELPFTMEISVEGINKTKEEPKKPSPLFPDYDDRLVHRSAWYG